MRDRHDPTAVADQTGDEVEDALFEIHGFAVAADLEVAGDACVIPAQTRWIRFAERPRRITRPNVDTETDTANPGSGIGKGCA